jgi:hypothetical protein
MTVDVARVVPSAGTLLGRVAVIGKSGAGTGLDVQADVAFGSEICRATVG